jgi:hypothetical protein
MRLADCKTNAFGKMALGTEGRKVKVVRLIANFWYRNLDVYTKSGKAV